MIRVFLAAGAVCLALCLPSCSRDGASQDAQVAAGSMASGVATSAPPSGERLAYLVGCINCHHQTPKEIINAPPLVIVQGYSLPEFRTLMKTGVTPTGRDLFAESNVMGFVAKEQFSHFTEEEIEAVHDFLQNSWTMERAAQEEAKIPRLPSQIPEFG